MFEQISKKVKQLYNPHNVLWYVFIVVLLAITWSGVKAVQTNYELQKEISRLKQENAVLALENDNIELNNQYLKSDQYDDLAARQNLGLAAPGETVLLVPKTVALKYVDSSITMESISKTSTQKARSQPKAIQNLEAWRDFLLGRTVLSD